MALSLNDIKKNKTARSKAKKTSKKSTVKRATKSTSSKTKPWEKPKFEAKTKASSPIEETPDLLKDALDWGKKIKLFPEIDIPVPKFFLTKDGD